MISTQYINLNMVPSGVMPVLHCSQYDVGRPLGVVIYNGSESVDLSGYTVTIEGTRTDGTPITAAVTTDDNIGVFVTTPEMTNKEDKYFAKLALFDTNSRRVASLAFVMVITPATMDENAEPIQEDRSLYQQYTAAVQVLIAEIREDIADLQSQWHDTVADMKADTNLKTGMYVRTGGYYAVNDGGGALYRIYSTAPDVFHETLNNGLYAVIIHGTCITPKMFGAVGNGVTDDTVAIQSSILYAIKRNVNTVHFSEGVYAVEPEVFQINTITDYVDGLMITGDGKLTSRIKLLTHGADCWLYNSTNNEKYIKLTFVDVGFFADDTAHGNGFLLWSIGHEKQMRFMRCDFVFKTIAKFAGTGNADLNSFLQSSFEAYGTAFILDNPQSVSTDFVATSGFCHADMLEVRSGGCMSFYGGDFDNYGTASSSVVRFPASGDQGIGNLGINFNSCRFELHNQHKLVLCDAENAKAGKVVFNGCNIGVADVLGSDAYHVSVLGNKRIDFINCSLSSALKYLASANFATSGGVGAVINFRDCVSNGRIWEKCTAGDNAGRISGSGNTVISQIGGNSANDFDYNVNALLYDTLQPRIKFYNALKKGSALPKSGSSMRFTLPNGCYIKRIYLYRRAYAAASTAYQLHIGNSDKSVVYGETPLSTFAAEQIIDVHDVGYISDNVVLIWATGETTSVVESGVCYVEYI